MRNPREYSRVAQSLDAGRLMGSLRFPRADKIVASLSGSKDVPAVDLLASLTGIFLRTHSLHHGDDRSRIRIHDSHELLDSKIAIPLQFGRKIFGFRRQSLNLDIGRNQCVPLQDEIDMSDWLRGSLRNKFADLVLLIK